MGHPLTSWDKEALVTVRNKENSDSPLDSSDITLAGERDTLLLPKNCYYKRRAEVQAPQVPPQDTTDV